MVVFHDLLHIREKQSTPGTASFLTLQQGRPALRHLRMLPQSARPVQQVPIIETRASPDLLVPHNERVIVFTQSHTIGLPEDPVSNAIRKPVAPGYPMAILLGMTTPAPPMEFVVEQVIHPAEHLLGYH